MGEKQQINVRNLEGAILRDLAEGRKPFMIVGAFGTTGSASVDDLDALAKIAEKYQLWFHVDAAYAGSALVLPEMRELAYGIDQADSIVINPHKWLLTTFDCSAFFIKDRSELLRSLSILPEYLKTNHDEQVVNFRDWGPGLGRRFRSLKLWFVLRWYGAEGLRGLIRNHLDLSKTMETWTRSDPRFEISVERRFNVFCFRLRQDDQTNLAFLKRLNESGQMFLTHTKINNRVVLRMVIGQTDVNEQHLRDTWDLMKNIAAEFQLL